MQLKDKLFVVTGAGSGLGEASARSLYAGGAYVAVLDRDKDAGQNVCKELGQRAKFFYADLGDDAGTEEAINQSIAWSKEVGKPVSGAVNCAGIGFAGKIVGRDNKPFDLEAFKYVLQINLIGTYNVSRLVAAHMCSIEEDSVSGERGCIVMVSSAAGRDGQTGQTPYSASKGGVNGLTLPMARDLARHKIRVVTVAPTLFSTKMGANTPTKAAAALQSMLEFPNRFGNADEFGHLVKSMIENTYVNGDVYNISGASRLGKL
ncbi:protein of unknown function [Taphrina deformans PYCC 5710]|uniref:Ketoreductase domain-containing protein n=1 Tax=Taphrina deformans (strain PYCC 5710 / ATCC 11124 / CBS 356.35 / IMI 108563 / JCM 9778 / NBRC 8474) TaxID=1097556 RepID=R4XL16_TAPDE|nr:protein of unknown function [Taphrina deformans PYCC 5710]|eukprot:CCG84009.1 protein of unknown function [Taphrina deformans PYCC 5710]